MSRDVTIVLLDRSGGLRGALPPFTVEVPWWRETGPLVRAAYARHGARIAILRLLHGAGNHVTARVAELKRPIVQVRRAVIYADFLDVIEPAERPYHEADIPAGLRAAVSAYRAEHG